MQHALAEVMEHEFNSVHLLTAHVGFRSKCEMFMAYGRAFQETHPHLWKELTSVLEALNKANSKRNAYVHALWRVDDNTGEIRRSVSRVMGGRFVFADEPTTPKELADAAQEIYEAGDGFVRFQQRFGFLGASHPRADDRLPRIVRLLGVAKKLGDPCRQHVRCRLGDRSTGLSVILSHESPVL